MMGTALLFREQARVFDRDGNLSGGSLHDFEIARLEDVFAIVAHRSHHSRGLLASRIGAAQNDLASARWAERSARVFSRLLPAGTGSAKAGRYG